MKFSKEDKEMLKRFLSSFSYDNRLAKYDIEVSLAWTKMLSEKKIIDRKKVSKVIKVLSELSNNLNQIYPEEDVHFAVEKTIEKILGEDKTLAGVIRTARSRNDLVVCDERLYLKDEIKNISVEVLNLVETVINFSEKNMEVIMCGNTHLQPAQPVLLSHYILSFGWMLLRDFERLKDCYNRNDVFVLGSAAFAGTTFEIDREMVAKKLGFKYVSENSVDSVSDRDFIMEFVSCCSILMMHLSRMCEEFILWLNPNFGYISLPIELTSGSSIMPQKQNPDYLELIRAKSARVYSNFVGISTLMKSLPLSYNRDMQEDKIYLFDTVDTVSDCLRIMNLVMTNIKVNPENLKASLRFDYILATEFANFLVEEFKLEFKLAHKMVNSCISYCLEKKKMLSNLSFLEMKSFINLKEFSEEKFLKLKKRLDYQNIINSTVAYGGTSPEQVRIQISNLRKLVKKGKKWYE